VDIDLFDFDLPSERIALKPVRPRDSAKLLLARSDEPLSDHQVHDLPGLLRRGDVLVLNDTKVIPAQLEGRRGEAKIGATLHKKIDLRRWQAFIRNARRVRIGDDIDFGSHVVARAEARHDDGSMTLHFLGDEPVELLLERAGVMPLPPYIASRRPADEADKSDYQTLFARALHFTPALMDALQDAGIEREMVTLHVGAGTFLPVKVQNSDAHVMHSEWGQIDEDTVRRLNAAKDNGGRIIAVGTTSLRLLESAAGPGGRLHSFAGDTDIFIRPGYQFRFVDGLMTNFHLPRSTLFMLVSALMGLDRMQQVYAHATHADYRFYSYGDSSLLLP